MSVNEILLCNETGISLLWVQEGLTWKMGLGYLNTLKENIGDLAQLFCCLLPKHKVLSSIPGTKVNIIFANALVQFLILIFIY